MAKAKNGKTKEPPPGERKAGPELEEAHKAHTESERHRAIYETAEEIASIEEEIAGKRALIAKAKQKLKKEYNVSKGAFAAAFNLYKMEDDTARNTLINDTLDAMRALELLEAGVPPMFARAGVDLPQSRQVDLEELTSAEQEGRTAFSLGLKFDACPYVGMSESAKVNRDFWERGWLAVQKESEDRPRGKSAGTPQQAAAH